MRLEFRLKKKGKGRWRFKTVLGGIVLVVMVGIYLSPLGKTGIRFIQKGWGVIAERAQWQLDQVIVEGHKRTDKKTIIEALGIRQGQKMNAISLSKVRQNLLNLPWVKEAIVERYLPDKLVVRITEKTPIALWQNNQTYQPLDERGQPIKDNKLLPVDLILVVGADAPEQTLSLLAALEQVPGINAVTRSAVRVEKRRWNLHLLDPETGVEVMLPETGFDVALKRLEHQEKKEKLLQKNLQAIDMRLKDRIILHPKRMLHLKKGKNDKKVS